jgi:hypothetical protein
MEGGSDLSLLGEGKDDRESSLKMRIEFEGGWMVELYRKI